MYVLQKKWEQIFHVDIAEDFICIQIDIVVQGNRYRVYQNPWNAGIGSFLVAFGWGASGTGLLLVVLSIQDAGVRFLTPIFHIINEM